MNRQPNDFAAGSLIHPDRKAVLEEQIRRRVAPISYTFEHIRKPGFNIIEYTKHMITKNELRRLKLDRTEVSLFWVSEIDRVYSVGDVRGDELVAQIRCPLYNDYWESRETEGTSAAGKVLVSTEGFRRSERKTTRIENRRRPGCLYMTNSLLELLVPGPNLQCLEDIASKNLIREVLDANRTKKITFRDVKDLWIGIVLGIFHFENPAVKEAKFQEMDSMTIQQYQELVLERDRQMSCPRDDSSEDEKNSVGSCEHDNKLGKVGNYVDGGARAKGSTAPMNQHKQSRRRRTTGKPSLIPKNKMQKKHAPPTKDPKAPSSTSKTYKIKTPAKSTSALAAPSKLPGSSSPLSNRSWMAFDGQSRGLDLANCQAEERPEQPISSVGGGRRGALMMQAERSSGKRRALGDYREED